VGQAPPASRDIRSDFFGLVSAFRLRAPRFGGLKLPEAREVSEGRVAGTSGKELPRISAAAGKILVAAACVAAEAPAPAVVYAAAAAVAAEPAVWALPLVLLRQLGSVRLCSR
jgi:hypothetical protein